MRFTPVLFLLLPLGLSAQSRNEQVRVLNDIVVLMDAASRLNQTYYFDTEQLAKAIYESRERVNPNYFYSSRTRNSGTVYSTDLEKAFRFPELKPDANQHLPAYMADLIPYLEAREKVQLLLKNKKYSALSQVVSAATAQYIAVTDSLFQAHAQLADCISGKAYQADEKFRTAKALLQRNSRCFDACHNASADLYQLIERYFRDQLPPYPTHAAVRLAEQEMALSMQLLDQWQQELYAGNNTQNQAHDAAIRQLNIQGLSKDSLYLYKTRGYGKPNSGWWPHTRYRTFFTSMHSTLYWYIGERYSSYPYLKSAQQHYNKFVLSYNQIVENYNRFTEIADGKTFTTTSSCCLGPTEIDTNQNVLLTKPRLLYRYDFVDTEAPVAASTPPPTISDTLYPKAHAAMIAHAVPHHLIYLLDASSSMQAAGKLSQLQAAAKYLVELQRASDHISMVSFATKAHVLLDNQPCDDKPAIHAQIDRLHALGSTNIDAGMRSAFGLADSSRFTQGKTKILLITDGLFEFDKASRKLLKKAKEKSVGFSIIYLGYVLTSEQEKELTALCAKAGGQFYNASEIDLRAILVQEASQ